MRDPKRWSHFVTIVGALSLVVGSVDPMEGSVLILPGSGLLALGSYLGREPRRVIAYRVWSFVLVALGVAALFGLSATGGVGGISPRSAWWALLIVPYLIGWSIDICGPGLPRWVSLAGIVIGAWYLAILVMVMRATTTGHSRPIVPAVVIAVVGIATIVASALRLWRPPSHGA